MNTWAVIAFVAIAVVLVQHVWSRLSDAAWGALCDKIMAAYTRQRKVIQEQDAVIKDQNRIIARQMERIIELETEGEEWKQA